MTQAKVPVSEAPLAFSPANNTARPSLRDMEMFLVVVRRGSFSAAGRATGLSAASVSRYISQMENKLGVRLLNRTTRKLSVTELGRLFYARAENILVDVEGLYAEISEAHAGPQGVLRVHSRVLVGHEHIAPSLSEFVRIYPDIRVDLSLSNENIDLVENNIDVDIRIGKLANSSLIAKKLVSSSRLLVASPAYLSGRPNVEVPHDLVHHQCLTYRRNPEQVVWRFRNEQTPLEEVPIESYLQTNSGTALKLATLEGLGISLMPDWSVRRELQSGALINLLPQFEISFTAFDNGIYAVYPPTRHLAMRTRVFIDYLSTYFRRLS